MGVSPQAFNDHQNPIDSRRVSLRRSLTSLEGLHHVGYVGLPVIDGAMRPVVGPSLEPLEAIVQGGFQLRGAGAIWISSSQSQTTSLPPACV